MALFNGRLPSGLLLCAVLLGFSLFDLTAGMRAFSEEEAWRYHYYIRAAYCDYNSVRLRSCGSACVGVPGF